MKTNAWFANSTLTTGLAGAIVVAVAFSAPAYADDDRYAAIVIDGDTNQVLMAENADATRYPASLTKMMTLYLLFEQMKKGEVKPTDWITASWRAERQAPSRIGLRAGDRITVQDAIEALVTKSANDVALAVAEHLAGTESSFAARMTAKAHQLGMNGTRYVNASGLPDDEQITTARDLATLSESLVRDFPEYYRYFQTADFSWRNVYARNHNGLLGRVDGVDGIKTGYTRMSGFNLASSAVRDGHRVFAVVLGGETARARDNQMAHLIDEAFLQISARVSGRPAAPDVTYTSLPVTRVTVQPPPVPPIPAVALVAPTLTYDRGPAAGEDQGDEDESFVIPVPFQAKTGSTPSAQLSLSVRGTSKP